VSEQKRGRAVPPDQIQEPAGEFEPGIENPYQYEGQAPQPGVGRFSKWMLIVGVILTVIGLFFGLLPMVLGSETASDSPLMNLLMLAPMGFMLMFAGITGWVIAGGK